MSFVSLCDCGFLASEICTPRSSCDFIFRNLHNKSMLSYFFFFLFNCKIVKTSKVSWGKGDVISRWRTSSLPLRAGICLSHQAVLAVQGGEVLPWSLRSSPWCYGRWGACLVAQGVRQYAACCIGILLTVENVSSEMPGGQGSVGNAAWRWGTAEGSDGAGVCFSLGYSLRHIWCQQSCYS